MPSRCSRRCVDACPAIPESASVLSCCNAARRFVTSSTRRDKLDANRQRQSKWTTDAELAVLTKLWGRMARRDDRCFDFTYSKLQKGRTAEIYFSAKAVKRKLAELKAVLPAEHYDFIAHTPADEMAVMLPLYQQLADANGRQQVSNGAASTLGLGLELGSCSSTYVNLRDGAVTGRGSDHHCMGTQPLQSAISRSDLLRTVGLFLFLLLLLLGVALS